MKIKRELFVHLLESCMPGVSPREVVQQSSSFVFTDGDIITFNEEIAVRVKSPLKITCAVLAEPLLAILRLLVEDEIEIEKTEKELLVKGNRRRAGIAIENEILLPLEHLETPKKWKPLSDNFRTGVGLVKECASTDEAKFDLTCIHVHPEWIEAFDEYQLARYQIPTGVKAQILIKKRALQYIIPLGMSEFSETETFIHFRNQSGIVLSCRRYVADDFPDKLLTNILNKAGGDVVILPKGLKEACDKAEVFSSTDVREDNKISISLAPGRCRVRGEGHFGWFTECKKIKYDGPVLSFLISPELARLLTLRYKKCRISKTALRAGDSVFSYVASLSSAEKKTKKDKTKNKPTKTKKAQTKE